MSINPNKVRYLKLGANGGWERECLERGIARFGFESASPARFEMCRASQWAELRQSFLKSEKSQATATSFTNQTRHFFEDDGSTLWLTFNGNQLYWGQFSEKPAEPHSDGDGVLRHIEGGWKSHDFNGEPLTKNRLSGKITRLAAFRGTSCSVEASDYIINRINGKRLLEVEAAIAARDVLHSSLLALIRLLAPPDFELLVDLVFTASGWRRESVVGKTVKTLDMAIRLPSTGERALVQVKSRTTPQELESYADQFADFDDFHRMFFVYHSGQANSDDKRITVIGPEKLAQMALDAGLTDWLIDRTS